MYDAHVPRINAAMRACPDTFARAIMFAILSARQPFVSVPDQMKTLARDKAKSKNLFGWKAPAYAYVTANKAELWRDTLAAPDSEAALVVLCRVPGLGIVKAAFVLQMFGHDIACLDSRNIEREGLNPRAYRSDGPARKASPAFRRKIARYVGQTSGRARELWNTWCEDVSVTYKLPAEHISRLHMTSIVPVQLRGLPPVQSPCVSVMQSVPF